MSNQGRFWPLLVILTLLTVLSASLATPPGPDPVIPVDFHYSSSGPGRVSFSHTVHMERFNLTCVNCHPQPFAEKREGSGMKMVDVDRGRFCGACHNGNQAFGPNECGRCHRLKN